MSLPAIEHTGQTVGKWTVLGRAPVPGIGHGVMAQALWICRCSCGNERQVRGQALRLGRVRATGGSTQCDQCHRTRRKRRCRHCDTTDERRFHPGTSVVCRACERRGSRNGYCGFCQRPLYRTRPCDCSLEQEVVPS